ncbi:hypothetical protein LK459_03145 [Gordonia otitidis]|uniref:hypothetical protein n=1 Tax=Gordonia otitidis TaxID=249058 RepID=UPI001D1577AD|nr:hypothetical protein [Gordonia otitidis]UEA59899.1 hypothetical protein LK459_03145 [Gordonia otitidis]
MQAVLDTPSRGSLTTAAIWTGFGEKYFDNVRAAVTNDADAYTNPEVFAPSGGTVVRLPMGELTHPSRGVILCLSGCPADEVRALGALTGIGTVNTDGSPLTASALPTPLIVGDSVETFQVQTGFRHANEGGINTRFDC